MEHVVCQPETVTQVYCETHLLFVRPLPCIYSRDYIFTLYHKLYCPIILTLEIIGKDSILASLCSQEFMRKLSLPNKMCFIIISVIIMIKLLVDITGAEEVGGIYTYIIISNDNNYNIHFTSGALITHFYGKAGADTGTGSDSSKPPTPTPDTAEEGDDDLASLVKRRRLMRAKALAEKEKLDKEKKVK